MNKPLTQALKIIEDVVQNYTDWSLDERGISKKGGSQAIDPREHCNEIMTRFGTSIDETPPMMSLQKENKSEEVKEEKQCELTIDSKRGCPSPKKDCMTLDAISDNDLRMLCATNPLFDVQKSKQGLDRFDEVIAMLACPKTMLEEGDFLR
uniref:Uncharacterized protein n=1 Tax=Chenopodium quinoa TaxID=63459 RepID=A0A803MIF5_CHEQI